jgi:hypothetical protein
MSKETSLRTEEIIAVLRKRPDLSAWSIPKFYRCSSKLVWRLKCELLEARLAELGAGIQEEK